VISKKITVSMLLIATIGCNNHLTALSDAAYAECYKGKDSEYRYLEFYFIEQPKNLLNASLQKSRAIILGIAASTFLANSKLQYFKSEIGLNTVAASILGLTGFDVYSSYKETEIKHDVLVKFIANLDFHKQYIPASLVPAFEELAATFNASRTKTFLTNDVHAIFEVIQHVIEHEFATRYAKEKKKDEDALGLFKTVVEISKNLK
jgi:hypothetical protein